MDVFEAVRTILAVRKYRDTPISDESLSRIIEAGRLSASAMNRQPWHFIAVRERAMLRRLAGVAPTAPYIAEAQAAIVVTIEPGNTAISDASRAIHSMMLTAWDDGIGSNWGGYFGLDAVKPLLDIPDALDVIGIVPLGYPLTTASAGRKKRKPVAEVASRERYGRPFP